MYIAIRITQCCLVCSPQLMDRENHPELTSKFPSNLNQTQLTGTIGPKSSAESHQSGFVVQLFERLLGKISIRGLVSVFGLSEGVERSVLLRAGVCLCVRHI